MTKNYFQLVQRLAGGLAMLLGGLGVLGWVLTWPTLHSVRLGLPSMTPLTACAVWLAGTALLIWRTHAGTWRRRAVRGCGAALIGIGVLVLALNQWVVYPHAVDWLLTPTWLFGAVPTRMASNTALCLALLGAAFWLLDVRRYPQAWKWLGQWLVLATGIIAYVVLMGYVFGLETMTRLALQNSMALPTALAILCLSLGLLYARPEVGLTSLLANPGPGGTMLRVLLPLLFFSRLALSWLIETGARQGWYERVWVNPLFAVLSMLVMLAVVWLAAHWLEGLYRERQTAQQSLNHYRLLAEHARDIMFFIAPDGRILEANRAAVAAYGFTHTQLLTLHVRDLRAQARQEEEIAAQLQRARETGVLFETEHQRADGSSFPVEISSRAVGAGTEQIVLSIVRDISERRAAETALRESEERFAKAFQASPLALTISSLRDGRLVEVNDTFVKTTGYTRAETLGKTTLELGLWKRPADRTAELAIVRQAGHLSDAEYTFVTKAGVELTGLLAAEKIEIAGEAFALTVIQDITHRKQLEREREELLTRAQHARQLAEEANRAKDEWLAMVTHELRSPLNAILGHARLLKARHAKLAPDFAHFAELVRRNGERQNEIINDLLDTARITTGKLRLESAPLKLTLVIQEALTAVTPAAQARDIRLLSDLEDAGALNGDATRLHQVVLNLLTNAIKFTPPGGTVQINLQRQAQQIVLTVSDTGQGIAPDFLPHIFERFSQADTSRSRRYGGLGLGLALAQQIVEAHGGTITAASAGHGQGTTFTVTLPVRSTVGKEGEEVSRRSGEARESAAPSLAPSLPRSSTPPVASSLTGVSVLVVEDEADARAWLVTWFQEQDAEVCTAANATEAWQMLSDGGRPQLLVCDISLPDEDGLSLLRRLRAWEKTHALPPLPALALTAHDGVTDRMQSLQAGFQMHVAKPIEPDELLAVIQSLLNRARLLRG